MTIDASNCEPSGSRAPRAARMCTRRRCTGSSWALTAPRPTKQSRTGCGRGCSRASTRPSQGERSINCRQRFVHNMVRRKSPRSDNLFPDRTEKSINTGIPGERYFVNEGGSHLLYFAVLLLTGQIERAAHVLFKSEDHRVHGVHIALLAHQLRLLLCTNKVSDDICAFPPRTFFVCSFFLSISSISSDPGCA